MAVLGVFLIVGSLNPEKIIHWQTANGGAVVDKVLGVVWGPNSTGARTDATCAEGN